MAQVPVRRKYVRKLYQFGALVAQSRGVGVLKRLVDMEPDIRRAPRIVKADIKQVRAERQLHGDADLIEVVILPRRPTLFDRREEAFGIVVSNTAKAPALAGPTKRDEFAWTADRHAGVVYVSHRQCRQRRHGQDTQQVASRREARGLYKLRCDSAVANR